jgi:hypothetical protein
MKAFKIDRNSWHFNLATRYGFLNSYDFDKEFPEDNPDFCKYVQSTIAGFGLCIAIIAMLAAIGFVMTVLPIIILTAYFQYGALIDAEFLFIVGVIWVALIFGTVYLSEKSMEKRRNAKYQKYLRDKTTPPEPSFSQLLYKKFKEKTCFRIEVV